MSTAAVRLAATRKKLGQVFTPRPVADWMARWACASRPRRILEPAVGEGVFVEAIESIWRKRRWAASIEAVEVDPVLAKSVQSRTRALSVVCRVGDFLRIDFDGRFDAIISNPPYVRHHAFDCDEAVRKRFDHLCGERISRNTNLYGLFLLRIWALLAPNGRAAIITPAEWLNADFGVALKRFLLRQNALEAIVQFDPATNLFPGVLTTAAITMLRRDRTTGEPIRFCRAADSDQLSELQIDDGRHIRGVDLDADSKWSGLFFGSRLNLSRGITLGEIARCSRGIATGANHYFALRRSELQQWGLSQNDARPCLTGARQAASRVFSRQSLRELIERDDRIFLFCPRGRLTRAVRGYLKEGRRRGIDRRYLPAHRPVWYKPEERIPAPILVSVFARGRFRFILNEARSLNLTAYHGIYPVAKSRAYIRSLFEYLSSEPGQSALRRHCRIYGDGLLKVEPRDVEAMEVPPELRTVR